ncbi:MAG: diguanylate cyclase [Sulfurimonadaceae bacterium]|jgi:diguanylate cyclase (GGDEF)-like protein|nr:diguanylate cyclase [Sulfurimonadaceae bacterium]
MKFPNICDIATRDVVTVSIDAKVIEAVEVIFASRHRAAIVFSKGEYFVFGSADILNLITKNISLDTPLNKLELTKIPTIGRYKNILDTIDMMSSSVEYIAVIKPDGSLYGVITHTDITNNIDPETLMENYKLQDFLKLGRRMKWVNKDVKTSKLLEDITLNSFDNAIIVEDLRPIGILTTKDVIRLVKERADLNLPVSHYMASPVETVGKDCAIKGALEFIREKHFKRVVVVDEDGRLSGVITQKELIKLSYSHWNLMMQEYQEELKMINSVLENKAKEYEEQASHDSLTGLYNRYKFAELYNLSYKTMLLRESQISLLLLDIDNFKKINDTYGHNKGDNVLKIIARKIESKLRNIDIVCRWGGEEFVVLLPTADLAQAIIIAEKIRESVADTEIETVGQVTLSIGVASVQSGDEMHHAIERADKALYLAKHSGKNLVKTEEDIA